MKGWQQRHPFFALGARLTWPCWCGCVIKYYKFTAKFGTLS